MYQNKVKILIACHKPVDIYYDDVYTPIHVGRAISKYKNEMADMIGDDTGQNISSKNPYYCELTAQYWAWKNMDCEYIGLCHYRRFFEKKITKQNICEVLKTEKDVLLVSPSVFKTDLLTRLLVATSQEEVYMFLAILRQLYPDYYITALTYLRANKLNGYNMFIMRKEEFDRYAEWQFRILEEMEKYVKISGYTRAKRIYGLFSEMMLTIYCIKNKLHIKTQPIVSSLGEKTPRHPLKRVKEFVRNVFFLTSQKACLNDPATLLGLKIDYPNATFLKYLTF